MRLLPESLPRSLELESGETTQVQFNQRKGPRGGMADASILGTESGTIHISRHGANPSDTPAYLPNVASMSDDDRRTEASHVDQRVLPRLPPGDSAKATIDAA
jgi:hypothetical protein